MFPLFNIFRNEESKYAWDLYAVNTHIILSSIATFDSSEEGSQDILTMVSKLKEDRVRIIMRYDVELCWGNLNDEEGNLIMQTKEYHKLQKLKRVVNAIFRDAPRANIMENMGNVDDMNHVA